MPISPYWHPTSLCREDGDRCRVTSKKTLSNSESREIQNREIQNDVANVSVQR